VVTRYKVVETSDVTDVALEQILNEWTARGWRLDAMNFAMRESSRRPAMAFVSFTREDPEGEDQDPEGPPGRGATPIT
jgi:hypothetical protein